MARRALIFDLDGTLWNSTPWYAELAAANGHSATPGQAAARLLKGAGYTKTGFAKASKEDPPPIYPGVKEALRSVAARDIALGVVTNLPAWMAVPMLEAAGINALFSVVVDYTTTSRHKPQPDPLLHAAQQMDVETSQCWYVGDDPNDATAAGTAGIRFAWAAWGYTAHPPIGTDRVLRQPGDVRRLHVRTT